MNFPSPLGTRSLPKYNQVGGHSYGLRNYQTFCEPYRICMQTQNWVCHIISRTYNIFFHTACEVLAYKNLYVLSLTVSLPLLLFHTHIHRHTQSLKYMYELRSKTISHLEKSVQDTMCALPWYKWYYTWSSDIQDQEYKHNTEWQTYRMSFFFFWWGRTEVFYKLNYK